MMQDAVTEQVMLALYSALKPQLNKCMLSLSDLKKLASEEPASPPGILVQATNALKADLRTLCGSLRASAEQPSPHISACLSGMSAFVLLPPAAALQTLSSLFPPASPSPVRAAASAALAAAADAVALYFRSLRHAPPPAPAAPPRPFPVESLCNVLIALYPRLLILLSLSRSHPSRSLRLSALPLLSPLLNECAGTLPDLRVQCLDSLLLRAVEGDEEAVAAIQKYRTQTVSPNQYSFLQSTHLTPHFTTLLSSLPSTLRSSSTIQLTTTLSLLTGHLHLSSSPAALSSAPILPAFLSASKILLEPDLDAAVDHLHSNALASTKLDARSPRSLTASYYRKRYKNLPGDGEAAATALVRAYGRCLAGAPDLLCAAVVGLFEQLSCPLAVLLGSYKTQQAAWLSRNAPVPILIQELLTGAAVGSSCPPSPFPP
ncbi:hypothetical protein TeGR_g14194, partial [Tetraparma gracilis]